MRNENEKTITFSLNDETRKTREVRAILSTVFEALSEKGYSPVDQIVNFILSDDPTYITSHKNARNLICRIDRYELISVLVSDFLGISER